MDMDAAIIADNTGRVPTQRAKLPTRLPMVFPMPAGQTEFSQNPPKKRNLALEDWIKNRGAPRKPFDNPPIYNQPRLFSSLRVANAHRRTIDRTNSSSRVGSRSVGTMYKTISRDNTAGADAQRSASFAYLGSKLKSFSRVSRSGEALSLPTQSEGRERNEEKEVESSEYNRSLNQGREMRSEFLHTLFGGHTSGRRFISP
ncbi:hypothetical protein F5Y03DRAFT_377650 [Xylaria venustula]|nr:hypothetical protein F5Y03DRAFT_377650 [Xylaria venustula]